MTHRPNPPRSLVLRALALLLVLMPMGRAIAQLPGLDLPVATSGPEVRAEARLSQTTAAPGDQAVVVVDLIHAPGWHTYPPDAKTPEALAGFAPFPVSIVIEAEGSGIAMGPIQWPASKPYTVNFTGEPIAIETFGGTARAFVPIALPASAVPGSAITLTAVVGYQACDDTTCLMPETVRIDLPLQVVTLEERAQRSGNDPTDLLAGFDPSVFATVSQWPAAGAVDPAGDAAGDAAGDSAEGAGDIELRPDLFGFKLPDPRTPIGLVVIFLAAAAGGLILNMTPCVLPVIPIKVMTISRHAGTPGRSLVLGIWMSLGVVAFWTAIGVPVAALTSFADPSRLFGYWWVTLGIGVLIAAMGVGIMGAFNLTLPEKVYAVNPKADSPWGSFVFGIMTAVLGLPCFGFVAGGLLAGSATFPPTVIMAIFVGLGVGMASPYMVLSAKPGLVNKIPRTGPASELVKQVMGLLLLAAAAYFAGSGLIALVNDKPWLGKQLHWWAIAGFAVAAGGWMAYRTVRVTRRPIPRVVFGVLGILIGVAGVQIASSFTARAKEMYLDRQEALAGQTGGLITTTWIDWTPALFEEARSKGYVVVLDFTAEWCLNCKALKAQVLSVEPVKGLLAQDNVVSMTVDLTSTSAPGWDKLRELGRTGIPTLAVFGPGTEQPWISGAYTSGQVVAAIERAGG